MAEDPAAGLVQHEGAEPTVAGDEARLLPDGGSRRRGHAPHDHVAHFAFGMAADDLNGPGALHQSPPPGKSNDFSGRRGLNLPHLRLHRPGGAGPLWRGLLAMSEPQKFNTIKEWSGMEFIQTALFSDFLGTPAYLLDDLHRHRGGPAGLRPWASCTRARRRSRRRKASSSMPAIWPLPSPSAPGSGGRGVPSRASNSSPAT